MKTTISILALMFTAVSAQAQLFAPATVGGAALGAIAGGVIGNNAGHGGHGTQGAVIGAVGGALIGSAYASSKRESQPTYYQSGGPTYYSASPGYYYASGPSYGPPVYRDTPAYARPSTTATTTLLGGVAGAIIGHNNGRHTWQGAAIGAGSGFILGRVIDSNRQRTYTSSYQPYAYYAQPQPVVYAAPQQQQPVQNTTIINNYYGSSSPMTGANSMFGR